MKKTTFGCIAALSAMLLVTSCKKDDTPAPTPTAASLRHCSIISLLCLTISFGLLVAEKQTYFIPMKYGAVQMVYRGHKQL